MSETGFQASPIMSWADKERAAEADLRRVTFVGDVRQHLAVVGPNTLLEKLASAHRYGASDGVRKGLTTWSPTEELFASYADTDGWDAVLAALADVIRTTRQEGAGHAAHRA